MATALNEVAARIDEIKRHMPEVYQSIQAHAAPSELGSEAFALVRRGLRGEANCFYAFEAGRVVGTPFSMPGSIMADVALHMVQFGVKHCVIWPHRTKVA